MEKNLINLTLKLKYLNYLPLVSMDLIGSLRSVTSQKFKVLSFPPVAKNLALGEIATVLI